MFSFPVSENDLDTHQKRVLERAKALGLVDHYQKDTILYRNRDMSQKLSLLDVQEKIKALQEEIKAERSNGLDMKQVFEYVGKHIERLHDYNDIKDIGQELMGQLAQRRGLTTADLYPEFEVDLED